MKLSINTLLKLAGKAQSKYGSNKRKYIYYKSLIAELVLKERLKVH